MDSFELAGGTILGRKHFLDKSNNQDAFYFEQKPELTVAFVCDGCGDKPTAAFSEIGAQIGIRLLTNATLKIAKRLSINSQFSKKESVWFWEQVRQEVLSMIRVLANQMGENQLEIVAKYFLFTTVGVLIAPYWTEFVSIGDGMIFINGQKIEIGPFSGNMPPYLGYDLLQTSIDPEMLLFKVQASLPTEELNSFLIGCDGLIDLVEAKESIIPINGEKVGFISQFWEDDLFFKNPFNITRRLTVINRDRPTLNLSQGKIEIHRGLLNDDTTLVVGRRKKEE
jgi:hypothetical protein